MSDRQDAINRLGWHHYDTTGSGHAGPCCSACHGEAEDGFGVTHSGDGCCCRDIRSRPRPTNLETP